MKDKIQARMEGDGFKAAWWVTEAIPGSFTRLNAATYWTLAEELPVGARVVEVGVDQGRSASMLLQALHYVTRADVWLVDSWQSVLIDNKAKTEKMLERFKDDERLVVHVMHMNSMEAGKLIDGPLDLVHIDAHHYHPSIDIDCETWLPKIKVGGVACLHDVQATFPDVDEAVAKYLTNDQWEHLGIFDCLGVWRRLA